MPSRDYSHPRGSVFYQSERYGDKSSRGCPKPPIAHHHAMTKKKKQKNSLIPMCREVLIRETGLGEESISAWWTWGTGTGTANAYRIIILGITSII